MYDCAYMRTRNLTDSRRNDAFLWTGASSSEQETTTVNALGQVLTQTDRNGNVHTLSYDVLGRVVSDAVTTLGSGVNSSVRRIDTVCDPLA